MPRAPFCFLLGLSAAALLSAPLGAADTTATQPEIPVEEIIQKFVEKETEFARARESYTYRQSVKLLEYDEAGGVRGKWEVVQDIIFGPNKERTERVVYAPVSTLRNIILTPQDVQDMRDVQPFVMTVDDYHNYHIRYLGTEKIDEIECYVFAVKPKEMQEGERYFEGQIWVDQLDLQIVKTYGQGVGILKNKKRENLFPRFETYRQQIDGRYWFPVYTRADDVLRFSSGDQRIRMIIKYEDYKRFGSDVDIRFGDEIPEEPQAQPSQPPQ